MNQFWQARTPREKILIIAGAALIGAALIVQVVLSPALSWRAAAVEQARTNRAEYELVARASTKSTSGATAAVPVRTALNDVAQRLSFEMTFVNALPDGSVEFQSDSASPQTAYALFAALESQYGVGVVAADISRSRDAPNMVRVQATLSQ